MLGLGAAVAGLFPCVPAYAVEPGGQPGAGGTAEPGGGHEDLRPVIVVLHSENVGLIFENVARAVAEELGIPAVSAGSAESATARGVLTITYRPTTRELAITYADPVRGTVTRVVPAPDSVVDVPGAAALVAGNLVRDQARDLLGVAPAPLPAPPAATSPQAPAAPHAAAPEPAHWLGNASLFFPLATNADEPELHTHFDFNLLYGHIGELNGLEVGTVSVVNGNASGLQAALLTNLVAERVSAGQLIFAFNSGRSLEGAQLAPVNRTQGAMQGLQVGALNLAGSLSKGVQIAAVNEAGDFEGMQIGLVNVGKRVHGMQLGLLNIADDVDGVPIGLISVSRAGGVHPMVWTSDTTFVNVGVKFGTRFTYTMLSGAAHSVDDYGLYGGGLTIGGSIPLARRVGADLDLQALHLFANTACCRDRFTGAVARRDDQSLAKVRASLRLQWQEHLSFFAGIGVTGKVTYPLRGDDTEVKLTLLPELFGGVQL